VSRQHCSFEGGEGVAIRVSLEWWSSMGDFVPLHWGHLTISEDIFGCSKGPSIFGLEVLLASSG
jgi:hypothetical protein